MNCPYCDNEMLEGIIQGGLAGSSSCLLFAQKIHKFFMKPKQNEVLLAKDFLGYANIKCHYCTECNKYIIDGNDIDTQG